MEYFLLNFLTEFVSLQAFLLKNILFNRESPNWRQTSGRLSQHIQKHPKYFSCCSFICIYYSLFIAYIFCLLEEDQKTALCSTLSEILESACSSPSTCICLVTWAKGQSPQTSTHGNVQSQTQDTPEPESSQPLLEQQPSKSFACHIPLLSTHSWWHRLWMPTYPSQPRLNHKIVTLVDLTVWQCAVLLCHALILQCMCVFLCLAALAAEDLGFERFHSVLQ